MLLLFNIDYFFVHEDALMMMVGVLGMVGVVVLVAVVGVLGLDQDDTR